MKTRRPLIALLAALALAGVVSAQEPAPAAAQDPPELAAARAEYLARLQQAMQPVNATYVDALRRLARTCQQGGRLEDLLHVQVVLAAFGQEAPPEGTLTGEEPPELKNLREDYEVRAANAMRPVQGWYLFRLRYLVDRLTQRGHVKEALAVRKEMARLPGGGGASPAAAPQAEGYLDKGEWKTPQGGRLTIEEETVSLQGGGRMMFDSAIAFLDEKIPDAYRITGEYLLSGDRGAGFVLFCSPDRKTGLMVNGTKAEATCLNRFDERVINNIRKEEKSWPRHRWVKFELAWSGSRLRIRIDKQELDWPVRDGIQAMVPCFGLFAADKATTLSIRKLEIHSQ